MTYQTKNGARRAKQQGDDARDFDTTSLRETGIGHTVHRDYLAHAFRWGFATRMIKGGTRVLDIGCGAEQPLAKLLSHYANDCPREMVMVDYANVKKRWAHKWTTLLAPFDFTKRWREIKPGFDIICCFEVVEHMQLPHCRKLLKGARELLTNDGIFLLSTPVFDPKVGMARNHINEMTVVQLQKEVKRARLRVEQRFGTFMNALECRHTAPEHQVTWKALRAYYSDDVLACFLAPLYPNHARNNLWLLKKG